MQKIREYFIGAYLRITSDVIEKARIVFIYRIILVALGLLSVLFPSLIINENYAQLIRTVLVWIFFFALLFTLRRYHSMRFASHALVIIGTANLWANIFVVFQQVDAVSSILAALAILYSFYYLRRRWALVYTLLNTLPVFILLALQRFDVYHIAIAPEKATFDEFYLSLMILFSLFAVILWHFRTAFNLSSETLGNALDEQKKLTIQYQSMSQELLKAKDKADEMNRLKDSFLANMSHEIRTPINGILGITQIIEEETTDLATKEYTALLKKSGNRLLHTMTSILEMAKLEAEKPVIQLSPVDLEPLIYKTMATMNTFSKEKRNVLIYEPEGVGLVCMGDEMLVLQVLRHIIENAVKFTEKGEITIKAGICRSNPMFVFVSVTDTGIGMKETFLTQIFHPFIQESSGQNRQFEGIGLGLYIAKKYVEMMGGNIFVKSQKGVGSSLEILLQKFV